MSVVGLFGETIVPDPLSKDHVPVAGMISALPAMIAVVSGRHFTWSGPAFAGRLFASKTRMLTSSWVTGLAQAPLFTVQRKVFTPTAIPVTPEVGDPALAKTPEPLTTVHWPVAGAIRLLPASVVELVGAQNC